MDLKKDVLSPVVGLAFVRSLTAAERPRLGDTTAGGSMTAKQDKTFRYRKVMLYWETSERSASGVGVGGSALNFKGERERKKNLVPSL